MTGPYWIFVVLAWIAGCIMGVGVHAIFDAARNPKTWADPRLAVLLMLTGLGSLVVAVVATWETAQ